MPSYYTLTISIIWNSIQEMYSNDNYHFYTEIKNLHIIVYIIDFFSQFSFPNAVMAYVLIKALFFKIISAHGKNINDESILDSYIDILS